MPARDIAKTSPALIKPRRPEGMLVAGE